MRWRSYLKFYKFYIDTEKNKKQINKKIFRDKCCEENKIKWFYREWLQLRVFSQWVRESTICVKSVELRFSWEIVGEILIRKFLDATFILKMLPWLLLGRARVKKKRRKLPGYCSDLKKRAKVKKKSDAFMGLVSQAWSACALRIWTR